MRFLVKTTVVREAAARRGSAEMSKAFGELKAYYQAQSQAGRLEAVYTLAGLPTGYTVWDVQSPEELDELLTQHPLIGVTDREIWSVSSPAGGGTARTAAATHAQATVSTFDAEVDRAAKTSSKH